MANEIARHLRKRMTPQEVKLWVHLRSWRARGFHFRRQAPYGRFIIDFICAKHLLAIEIDGGQHNFDVHAQQDRERDQHLIKAGYRVLRFWNSDVDRNLDGVLFTIDEVLRQPPPPDRPSDGHPPPQAGEG